MRVIAVDDECNALDAIHQELQKFPEITDIQLFDDPEKSIAFAKQNLVDVAFLDIEMYGISGLVLAKKLKEVRANTNIVFVTGYSEYAVEAFRLEASDYLLKPVSYSAVKTAFEQLRNPVDPKASSRIYVQCFGNFEIFTKGKPIYFPSAKTKELLAYLIKRQGAVCKNNEIISVLWEDKPDSKSLQSQFRNHVSNLRHILEEAGVEDILGKSWGGLCIIPERIQCDYYDFLQGKLYAVNRYANEFMAQYSWAEFTNAHLSN